MFELSNLVSFELHTLLIIVSSVLAITALVGIWAGLSRRHWFWRAGAILAWAALLIPIRADLPAVFVILAAGSIAVGFRILSHDEFPPEDVLWRWPPFKRGLHWRDFRFGIKDLLLAMALVGAGSTFLLTVDRSAWELDWLAAGLLTATMFVTAMSIVAVQETRKWYFRAALAGLFVACIGTSTFFQIVMLPDWVGRLDVFEYGQSNRHIYAACFLVACEYSLFVGLGYHLFRPDVIRGADGTVACIGATGWSIRAAAAAIALLPLAWVYVQMLDGPSAPKASVQVDYAEVYGLCQRLVAMNGGEQTESAIRRTDPKLAVQVEEANLRLLAAVEQPTLGVSAPEDSIEFHFGVGRFAEVRSVARAWLAEAQEAGTLGQADQQVRYLLGILRLGAAHQRGGTLLDWQFGEALREIAYAELGQDFHDLSSQQLGQIVAAAMEAEHRMDSFDVAVDRNDAVSDRFWGWQKRLSRILAPDLHRRYRSDNYRRSLFGRTWHRLLVIELKVEEFRRGHDRLPQSLSELHLEDGSPLLDPFSDRPLIYEATGETYKVYSVGRDGIDNGGNFDASKARYYDGYDLDLATLWRKG